MGGGVAGGGLGSGGEEVGDVGRGVEGDGLVGCLRGGQARVSLRERSISGRQAEQKEGDDCPDASPHDVGPNSLVPTTHSIKSMWRAWDNGKSHFGAGRFRFPHFGVARRSRAPATYR